MVEKRMSIFQNEPLVLVQILMERFKLIDKKVADEVSWKNESNQFTEEKTAKDFRQQEEEHKNELKNLSSKIAELIEQLSMAVREKQAEEDVNARLTQTLTEKEQELNEVLGKLSAKSDSSPNYVSSIIKQGLIDQLNKVIDTLMNTDYIISCSGNNVETEIMQNNIRNGVQKTLEAIMDLDVSQATSLEEEQTILQDILLKEMEPLSSWMRKLAIYSAYANIPFMIDEGRTDGIRFNREATMWSYALLDDLLASVGIKQIVPAPFIELISDGDYEDASDSATKNIGSFCPDYLQRIGKVDRVDSVGLIIDIADVGLIIDGQLFRQAKVII